MTRSPLGSHAPLSICLWNTGKGGCHDKREYDRRLRVHLHAVAVDLDLSPADRLVWPRTCIAPVELLRRVDVHGALGSIAHHVCVGNVVFDEAASQNDHARPLGSHRKSVNLPDILDNVHAQHCRRRLERVEEQHVAQAAVCQRRAEDGDVVLPRPVVDGSLVVDLLAQPMYNLAWRPVQRLVGFLAGLLLLEHGVENGHYPVFKGTVIAVGHDEVAGPVHPFGAQPGARRGERPKIRWR
jgi:hypothetical protein